MTPRSIVLSLAALCCFQTQALAAPQPESVAAVDQDKKAADEESKAKKKAEERVAVAKTIRSLEHQIRVSKLQAQLDRMKEASKATAASLAYTKATRADKAATDALTNFTDHQAPAAVETAKISLKSAQDSATHAADEFKELVAMYKADEFAEMTKELVLKRGRSRMALAKRRLEVREAKLANLQGFTNPAKLRELQGKVKDALAAMDAAKHAQEQTELEVRIGRMNAAFKAAELLRDLEAALKKKGTSSARHWSRMYRTQSISIERAFGPDSPPTMTQ